MTSSFIFPISIFKIFKEGGIRNVNRTYIILMVCSLLTTRKCTICGTEFCHNMLKLCYNIFLWNFFFSKCHMDVTIDSLKKAFAAVLICHNYTNFLVNLYLHKFQQHLSVWILLPWGLDLHKFQIATKLCNL